ncbi:hypothetical protein LINPERHAP1_LOCUS8231, partial [Linum perenne]
WFFPYCSDNHYVVYCVNVRHRVFEILDSVPRYEIPDEYMFVGRRVLELAARLIPKYRKVLSGDHIRDYSWVFAVGLEQKDNVSCGVFVCNYIEFWRGTVQQWMVDSWAKQVDLRRAQITVKMILSSLNEEHERVKQAAIAYVPKVETYLLSQNPE